MKSRDCDLVTVFKVFAHMKYPWDNKNGERRTAHLLQPFDGNYIFAFPYIEHCFFFSSEYVSHMTNRSLSKVVIKTIEIVAWRSLVSKNDIWKTRSVTAMSSINQQWNVHAVDFVGHFTAFSLLPVFCPLLVCLFVCFVSFCFSVVNIAYCRGEI